MIVMINRSVHIVTLTEIGIPIARYINRRQYVIFVQPLQQLAKVRRRILDRTVNYNQILF